jgi:uncharacterized protein (DUF3820 family)
MIMPFGKHFGRDVESLPKAYLKWLSTRPLYGQLKEAVEEALKPKIAMPMSVEEALKNLFKR